VNNIDMKTTKLVTNTGWLYLSLKLKF